MKLRSISKEKIIYLAGGCFWGVEEYFRRLNGVIQTEVGYANGKSNDTSYRELESTGHAEAVRIVYDANLISLREILLHFFRIIDPVSVNRQGNDCGIQYRTGIYYEDMDDLTDIEALMKYESDLYGKLAVEVDKLRNYVLAEEDHQAYLQKWPGGYCHINPDLAGESLFADTRPALDWEAFKKNISSEDAHIMLDGGTERAFSSPLNEEDRPGVYVDRMTGDVLFLSRDKFDSGSGWPSFTRPFEYGRISLLEDDSFGMKRIEVKSKRSKLHLGHVFDDGPIDRGGLRFCINGRSLDFIVYTEMPDKGYGPYCLLI